MDLTTYWEKHTLIIEQLLPTRLVSIPSTVSKTEKKKKTKTKNSACFIDLIFYVKHNISIRTEVLGEG